MADHILQFEEVQKTCLDKSRYKPLSMAKPAERCNSKGAMIPGFGTLDRSLPGDTV
jgi:hypothetical protein